MIILKAAGFTLLVAVVIILLIAIVYVSVWVILAVAIITLGYLTYTALNAKAQLSVL